MDDTQPPDTDDGLDPDESLLWLFSVAELLGTPDRGTLLVISPRLPYRRAIALSEPLGFSGQFLSGAGRSAGECVAAALLGADIGPTFGVLLPLDAWPRVALPGEAEHTRWLASHPHLGPLDGILTWGLDPSQGSAGAVDAATARELAQDRHPLSYAEVRGVLTWVDPWERLFGPASAGASFARFVKSARAHQTTL